MAIWWPLLSKNLFIPLILSVLLTRTKTQRKGKERLIYSKIIKIKTIVTDDNGSSYPDFVFYIQVSKWILKNKV